VAWGAPALALYFCCRYLTEGLHWTVPTMVFGLGGLLLLVPLGFVLLHGAALGPVRVPEMGAAGLGIATAAVLWLQLLGFLLYLRRSARFADLGLFSRFDWPRVAPI